MKGRKPVGAILIVAILVIVVAVSWFGMQAVFLERI